MDAFDLMIEPIFHLISRAVGAEETHGTRETLQTKYCSLILCKKKKKEKKKKKKIVTHSQVDGNAFSEIRRVVEIPSRLEDSRCQ